jgi:HAD superfamily hydrolase (TIGR01509 family)
VQAILFGSIGTLADTSELQRRSFNEAFAAHDLDWHWDPEHYTAMLAKSGGEQRIVDFAKARGQAVDAAAVHATKEARFHELLRSEGQAPRAGVVETIGRAKEAGISVALVTTTSPANVTAVLDALGSDVARTDFDVITDATHVRHPKPAPDAYTFALDALGVPAAACVAIEDNVGGVRSAVASGLTCIAFPNGNTIGHDFGGAVMVDRVDLDALRALTTT